MRPIYLTIKKIIKIFFFSFFFYMLSKKTFYFYFWGRLPFRHPPPPFESVIDKNTIDIEIIRIFSYNNKQAMTLLQTKFSSSLGFECESNLNIEVLYYNND